MYSCVVSFLKQNSPVTRVVSFEVINVSLCPNRWPDTSTLETSKYQVHRPPPQNTHTPWPRPHVHPHDHLMFMLLTIEYTQVLWPVVFLTSHHYSHSHPPHPHDPRYRIHTGSWVFFTTGRNFSLPEDNTSLVTYGVSDIIVTFTPVPIPYSRSSLSHLCTETLPSKTIFWGKKKITGDPWHRRWEMTVETRPEDQMVPGSLTKRRHQDTSCPTSLNMTDMLTKTLLTQRDSSDVYKMPSIRTTFFHR